jgi:hypothetical protein
MSFTVTETTYVGPFDRLKNSIKGVFLGFLLFVLAFPLLFWGERRTNVGELVEKAEMVDLNTPPAGIEGKHIKGQALLKAQTPATDPEFLNNANFLALRRHAEIYAWVEEKETKTEQSGGTEKKTTTYKYHKKWVGTPEDSRQFKQQQTPQNPTTRMFKDSSSFASGVVIGKLECSPEKATLMGMKPFTPSVDQWIKADGRFPSGSFVYFRQGADSIPQIGDERVSFNGWPLPAEGFQVSVAGSIAGSKIGPLIYDSTSEFLGLHPGTPGEMEAQLKSEHSMMTWIIRLVGFFMMFGGMAAIVGPFTTAMEYIPIVGSMGSSVIHGILFVIALFLTVTTIIFAKMFYVAIGIGVLVLGGLFFLIIKGLAGGKPGSAHQPAMAAAHNAPPPPPPPPPAS